MTGIIFLLLTWGGPEPMNVSPGDPIINVPITTLDGTQLKLKDALHNSMCFIISTDCPHCLDALPIIMSQFSETYHTTILFLDPVDKVRAFLKKRPLDEKIDFYTVNHKDLKPYNIKTIPALLGYKAGRLRLAFHGPLNPERGSWLVDMYENPTPIGGRKP